MNLRKSYLQGLQDFYTSKAPEDFVYVKGMDFNGNENLSPKSEVFIKNRKIHIDDFIMCDHPVTKAEFKAIFPKGHKHYFRKFTTKGEIKKNRPVEEISWYSAIAYCNKRSVLEGLTPCYTIRDIKYFDWKYFAYSNIPVDFYDDAWDKAVYDPSADGYRLPTEIEWEYAARGGVFLENSGYSGSNNLDKVAWYDENSSGRPHEVKKKVPNRLGLYDMSGNVWEWCWDGYDDINTNTPNTGNASVYIRVIRGGSWDNSAFPFFNVSYRNCYNPYSRYNCNGFGFRVVRSCSS